MSKEPKGINPYQIGAIKRAIEHHIHPANGRSDFYVNYKNWYIGVTNDPTLRKLQHELQKDIEAIYFKAWDAETKENALEVEQYFHEKGMQDKHGAGGAKRNSVYVYVFKIRANLLDYIGHILGILNT